MGRPKRPHKRTSVKGTKFDAGRGKEIKGDSGTYNIKITKHSQIPWSDKPRFYLNYKETLVIPVWTKYNGKGWHTIYVGEYKITSRNPRDWKKLMYEKYHIFNPKQISLFQSLSFHRGKSGAITNYGTKPYNLQFTRRIPLKKYKLATPIKSQRQEDFGKIIDSVTTYKWDYIVLKWNVDNHLDKITLNIKGVTMYPDGSEDLKYQTVEVPEKEWRNVVAEFKKRVSEYKKGKDGRWNR